jgi:type VI secretion system protein ImpH
LLERLYPENKALGDTLVPSEECVRLGVQPGLDFPPSDISALSTGADGGRPSVDVKFMGLIGPSGVLPYWYNELAQERARQKDTALIDFLNLFHHRLLSFFYLGWKKQRLSANYIPGAGDRLSRHLLSFIGLGTPKLAAATELPPEPLIYYSGHLSRAAPAATGIEAAVEYFTETDARVEQFIERMIPLAREDQTRLGVANAGLGSDAVCGSFAWECQSKFRVHLGPVSFDEFIGLLPSGRKLSGVFSLVRSMAGIEYDFDVCLILRRAEVPPCVLGAEGAAAPRLGWTTWLRSARFSLDQDPRVIFRDAA